MTETSFFILFQISITNLTLSRVDSVFIRAAAKSGGASAQLDFVGPPVGRQVEPHCTKPKTMPDISSLREEKGTLFVAIVAGAASVVFLVAVMSAVMLCRYVTGTNDRCKEYIVWQFVVIFVHIRMKYSSTVEYRGSQ
jgi:hypothetical protein